eukprot:8545133-Pyramimonas_sp.AAC.1
MPSSRPSRRTWRHRAARAPPLREAGAGWPSLTASLEPRRVRRHQEVRRSRLLSPTREEPWSAITSARVTRPLSFRICFSGM